MKQSRCKNEVDHTPRKNGERVKAVGIAAEDSTCDDPTPGGKGTLTQSIESRLCPSAHSSGCDRMNGTTATKQIGGGTSFPAMPRGRTPKPCPVCGREIVLFPAVTCSIKCSRAYSHGGPAPRRERACKHCRKPVTMYANSEKARAENIYCSNACRMAHEAKYGRSKIPSRPAAKIADKVLYGDQLSSWIGERGLSANNLSAICGVAVSCIKRATNGMGLSQYNYEAIGRVTGVW